MNVELPEVTDQDQFVLSVLQDLYREVGHYNAPTKFPARDRTYFLRGNTLTVSSSKGAKFIGKLEEV
jgi:hypothetical protein